MGNELAAQYGVQALDHFNDIDIGHTGTLNLLDIMNYEKEGPAQNQLGKFLQDNYDTIRGLSDRDDNDYGQTKVMITRDDLQDVVTYSGVDQANLDRTKTMNEVAAGAYGALASASVAIIPAFIGTGISSLYVGPASPLVGIGIEGTAGVAGYAVGANMQTAQENQKESTVKNMRL